MRYGAIEMTVLLLIIINIIIKLLFFAHRLVFDSKGGEMSPDATPRKWGERLQAFKKKKYVLDYLPARSKNIKRNLCVTKLVL